MCLQTLSKHTGSIDALLAVDVPGYDSYMYVMTLENLSLQGSIISNF